MWIKGVWSYKIKIWKKCKNHNFLWKHLTYCGSITLGLMPKTIQNKSAMSLMENCDYYCIYSWTSATEITLVPPAFQWFSVSDTTIFVSSYSPAIVPLKKLPKCFRQLIIYNVLVMIITLAPPFPSERSIWNLHFINDIEFMADGRNELWSIIKSWTEQMHTE